MFPSRMKLIFLIGKVLHNQRNKTEMRRLNTNSWSLHCHHNTCSWPLLQTMHFWDHDLLCCCLEALEEQYVSLPTAPSPAPSSFQAPPAESAWGLYCSGAPASSVSGNFKASHIQKQGDAWDRLLAPSMGATWGARWTNAADTVLTV